MANIEKEVEGLRDYVADLQFARIWMQYLPAKYTADELAIRYQGSDPTDETGYHYRLDRTYQLVYFGVSERDCITRVSTLERKFNNTRYIEIKDSANKLSVGSLSFSQPFKTEGGEVFAVIGILTGAIRQARDFEQSPKLEEIITEIQD